MEQNRKIFPSDVEFEFEIIEFLRDKKGKLWHPKLEDSGRYENATHTICKVDGCNEIAEYKGGICADCSHKRRWDKYNSLPPSPNFPISLDGERFFWDEGDLEDYCEENEASEEDLFLYATEQQPFQELTDTWWDDQKTEDGELPKELIELIDEFNEKLKGIKGYYFCDEKVRYKKD